MGIIKDFGFVLNCESIKANFYSNENMLLLYLMSMFMRNYFLAKCIVYVYVCVCVVLYLVSVLKCDNKIYLIN